MTGFEEQFQLDAKACETVLEQLITASKGPASKLRDAMAYGLLNGGKRVRASLVLAAARMVSGARRILLVRCEQPLRLNAFMLIH